MSPVRLILSSIMLISISNAAYAVAFGNPNGSGGTVYAMGSDIINPSDSNDFKEIYIPEYKNNNSDWRSKYRFILKNNTSPNIETRRYYEIKEKKWLYSKFYILEASYDLGPDIEIQVSYDDGKRSWQNAYTTGSIYAEQLGYIPPDLRKATHSITIHNHYNGLMGGNNNIIIFEKRGAEHIEKGSIEEALFHEATHNYFNTMLFKKQSPLYALWKQAQTQDNDHISYYAKSNDYEDIAESLIAYYAVKYKSERIGKLKEDVLQAIPHRMRFFEGVNLNLTHSDVAITPHAPHQIISAENQQLVDVYSDSKIVHTTSQSGNTGQYWQLHPKSDSQYGNTNRYQLTNRYTGNNHCLDIINGGPNDQKLHLKPCGNYSGQLFSLKPVGDEQYQLMPLWQKNLNKEVADQTPALNCISISDNEGSVTIP